MANRRRELANFLRKKRESLPPPVASARRRTPGLRREEVAEQAGVSTTWYTWLEQGRDARPSPAALRRIARALQLNGVETKYLFRLAGIEQPRPRKRAPAIVPPSVGRFVGRLRDPAVVLDDRMVPLLWNGRLRELFFDLDTHAGTDRNWLEIMFLDRDIRSKLEDWETHVQRFVAEFRDIIGLRAEEAWADDVVNRLGRECPEFQAYWSSYDLPERNAPLVIKLRGGGTFERLVIVPGAAPALRILVFTELSR